MPDPHLKYTDEICDELLKLMGIGLSFRAACAELNVHWTTAYDWVKKYPKFAEAHELGMGKRLAYLERGLLEASTGPFVTSRIFALKNACPEEWRDRYQHEHQGGGKEGNPIQINITSVEDKF